MSALLESDSETEGDTSIVVNKEYAKKYDTWRRKEELQKLKDKYGEDAAGRLDNVGDDTSSSSEEEDENAAEWTEENEKEFLKTLAYLKKKDPAIYDNSVKFFKDQPRGAETAEKVRKKEKPLLLRDYKRKLLLENKNEMSDDEEGSDTDRRKLTASPTLAEEERAIKESLTLAVKDEEGGDDDGGEGWGSLFQKRSKTQQELDKENEDYLEWLKGQREQLGDKVVESELKPLREYWGDPRLEEGEKFLRDFILNKRFLEDEDEDRIPSYEEIVHDSDEDLSADEHTIEQQEEFEHKFNFRFEEPDQEFVKRYPRAMANTLRKKDDRRKVKRAEWRERKEREKLRKLEEVKQLKALKRKELGERIQKLKEITGNQELGFKDEDIEGDFDPSEYDKRMKQLFDEEFYQEEQDTQKPVFPELDEDLELENWDQWDGSWMEQNGDETWNNDDLHCEDPGFNMDCDYDPKAKLQQELVESTSQKRKRRRQSKLAQALSVKKPVFDPQEKSFEEYVDQYYSLDFEDVIGDLPCRFKYRKVVPNSFGLTVDEILKADDRDLNSWCSLRKAVQYRPEAQELYDVKAYRSKAEKEHLKRKYLKSLYTETKVGEEIEVKVSKGTGEGLPKASSNEDAAATEAAEGISASESVSARRGDVTDKERAGPKSTLSGSLDASGKQNKKRRKRKLASGSQPQAEGADGKTSAGIVGCAGNTKSGSKKRKRKVTDTEVDFGSSDALKAKHGAQVVQGNTNKTHFVPRKKFKHVQSKQDVGISDARLRAYGIRPKEYKNKLKYGSKSKKGNK